jgi:hypothetical protein
MSYGVEIWRPVRLAPDYAVSNRGRIKRIAGSAPEARPYIGKPKKLTFNRCGYLVANLRYDGRDRTRLVHRIVCATFYGPAPSRRHSHVAHGNGDKSDNHAFNLRWATPTENAADKEIHGRVVRGEAHQFSKLTEAAVAEIRAAPYGQGGYLAAKYGVERTHISRIKSKTRGDWPHVPFPDAVAAR